MAQPQEHVIARIRNYVADARELHNGAMDVDTSDAEARLEQTVRELQARVDEQEAALNQVRASQHSSVYHRCNTCLFAPATPLVANQHSARSLRV